MKTSIASRVLFPRKLLWVFDILFSMECPFGSTPTPEGAAWEQAASILVAWQLKSRRGIRMWAVDEEPTFGTVWK